jgi:hypothetical protein
MPPIWLLRYPTDQLIYAFTIFVVMYWFLYRTASQRRNFFDLSTQFLSHVFVEFSDLKTYKRILRSEREICTQVVVIVVVVVVVIVIGFGGKAEVLLVVCRTGWDRVVFGREKALMGAKG